MTFNDLTKMTIAIAASALTFASTGLAMDAKADPGKDKKAEQSMHQKDKQHKQQQLSLVKLDSLQGHQISSRAGDISGEITEVVLNDDHDAIDFVLVRTDNDTLSAPWTAVTAQQKGEGEGEITLTLDDKATSEKPQRDQLQALQKNNTRMLKDLKIQAKNSQEAGTLNAILIESTSGKIAYGVASLDGEREARIPWDVFTVDTEKRTLTTDASLRAIHQSAYKKGEEPSMNDRAYEQKVDTAFGTDTQRRVHGYVGEEGDVEKKDADLSEDLKKSAEEIGDNVKELYNDAVQGEDQK